MDNSLLQKIYAVFDPSPLKTDQQNIYVNLDDVRGHSGIVHGMAQKIRLADAPTYQVLAGHRGSGKSTELVRLRQELETPTDGSAKYFVIQVNADKELDRNDIDFPEVLIAVVRQIAAQLKSVGIDLQPGYFKDRWEKLKTLALSEVDFEKLNLEMGLAKLAATIKNSPEARVAVRAALEPDTNNWLTSANEVIGVAKLELMKKGYAGLVVIVDDLDKMITRSHTAGCSTTEYLFVHRSSQLTAFLCHMIYTLPIELAYSHQEPNIRRLYNGPVPVVPMTKIATPPPNSKTHAAGVKKFRAIIDERLKSVGVLSQDLFANDKVRDDLIKLTGGQPTELMTLIREALVTSGLPIGPDGVKRGRQEIMRSYRRQLRSDHWPLLEEVKRTGQIARTLENEAAFRELLDSRAILLYRNDEEWYDINPAIDGLEPPAVIQGELNPGLAPAA